MTSDTRMPSSSARVSKAAARAATANRRSSSAPVRALRAGGGELSSCRRARACSYSEASRAGSVEDKETPAAALLERHRLAGSVLDLRRPQLLDLVLHRGR